MSHGQQTVSLGELRQGTEALTELAWSLNALLWNARQHKSEECRNEYDSLRCACNKLEPSILRCLPVIRPLEPRAAFCGTISQTMHHAVFIHVSFIVSFKNIDWAEILDRLASSPLPDLGTTSISLWNEWRESEQYLKQTEALNGEQAETPDVENPRVKLFGRDNEPCIDGRPVEHILTLAQYNVVKALIEAGPDGLTKDQLERKSGHGDARKVLKRLAKKSTSWADVISFPGTTGCGYRIK